MALIRRCGVWLLVCCAFLVRAAAADAATYYVAAAGGSDARSCATAQNVATPKASIGAGLTCLTAGDTLYVRAGTYAEYLSYSQFPSGSSWSNVVRIANYNGETVTLQPSGSQAAPFVLEFGWSNGFIEFDGIHLDGQNTVYGVVKINSNDLGSNAHHIRLKNARLTANPRTFTTNPFANQTAVMVGGTTAGAIGGNEFINLAITQDTVGQIAFYIESPGNLIEGCDVTAAATGIQLVNSYPGLHNNTSNNVVRNNRIHDIRNPPGVALADGRKRGIVARGTNNLIYNNAIWNIEGTSWPTAGIHLFEATSNQVYNNTVHAVSYDGILLENGTGNVVQNNIAYRNGADFSNNGSASLLQSNNLFNVDPQFMNSQGGDFRLRSSSPAIDAGVQVSVVTGDLVGTPRPQGGAYDVGAYEGQSGASASSGPPPPTGVRIVQ